MFMCFVQFSQLTALNDPFS